MRPKNNEEILNHSIFKTEKVFKNHTQASLESVAGARTIFFLTFNVTRQEIQGVSQLLKQSDWAQIQDFK